MNGIFDRKMFGETKSPKGEMEKMFGETKSLGFPRKNRHQVKRLFFEFQNFPGSSIQLKCADVFDCNKSQYTQRFHV